MSLCSDSDQMLDPFERFVLSCVVEKVGGDAHLGKLLANISDDPISVPPAAPEKPIAGSSTLNTGSTIRANEMPAISIDTSSTAPDQLIAGPSRSSTESTNRCKNLSVEEIKLQWNWWKILMTFKTVEMSIQFAEKRGLLTTSMNCSHHRKPMYLDPSRGVFGAFRCRKSNCRNQSVSRATGSWFEQAKLPIDLIFKLMYCFSRNLSYEDAKIECCNDAQNVLSSRTIADWYSHCRKAVAGYQLEHQEESKIHGPGQVLKSGYKKYYYGEDLGYWIVEYMWRRKIKLNHLDPFEELINCIKFKYKINL